MERRARCVWVEDLHFDTYSHNGKLIRFDGWKDHEREEAGPTPGEMIPMALGTCTGMDVVSILRKMRVSFKEFRVSAEAEREPERPKAFTKIRLTYSIRGEDIPEDKVSRAIELSQERYCTAAASLRKAIPIIHTLAIEEE